MYILFLLYFFYLIWALPEINVIVLYCIVNCDFRAVIQFQCSNIVLLFTTSVQNVGMLLYCCIDVRQLSVH